MLSAPSAPRVGDTTIVDDASRRSTVNVKAKFTGLDSLRGVAAVAVALYHFLVLGPHTYLFKSGHLAVDFFFCLSGFVIAYAYEERLHTGLTQMRFAMIRIVRFYPYYALGLVLGFGAWLMTQHGAHSGGNWSAAVAATLGLNCVFLPGLALPNATTHMLFPFNFPAWSLFCELAINLIYAATFRLLTLPVLSFVVFAFGLAVCGYIVIGGQSDVGYAYDSIVGGFLRCGFSFFMGILLFRLRDRMKVFPFSRLWLAGALLLCFVSPVPMAVRQVTDVALILLAFPAIVWLAASPQKEETPEPRLFRLLGATSYGLYAIHVPLIGMLIAMFAPLEEGGNHKLAFVAGIIFLAVLIGVIDVLDKRVDQPLRKKLLSRLSP